MSLSFRTLPTCRTGGGIRRRRRDEMVMIVRGRKLPLSQKVDEPPSRENIHTVAPPLYLFFRWHFCWWFGSSCSLRQHTLYSKLGNYTCCAVKSDLPRPNFHFRNGTMAIEPMNFVRVPQFFDSGSSIWMRIFLLNRMMLLSNFLIKNGFLFPHPPSKSTFQKFPCAFFILVAFETVSIFAEM